MEEIKNECTDIKKGKCMCEEDILNDILMCEKNISNNYSISVNEMSNKYLYKIVLNILNDSKNITREIYNIAFEKGYYSLKTESENEIAKALSEYKTKMKEMS